MTRRKPGSERRAKSRALKRAGQVYVRGRWVDRDATSEALAILKCGHVDDDSDKSINDRVQLMFDKMEAVATVPWDTLLESDELE
jgi:hypothetical protein